MYNKTKDNESFIYVFFNKNDKCHKNETNKPLLTCFTSIFYSKKNIKKRIPPLKDFKPNK